MNDEQLRWIARRAIPTGVYSGNVKQLRAVFDAGVAEGIRQAYAAVTILEDDEATSNREYTLNDALNAIDGLTT